MCGGELTMPIRRFLENSAIAFDPLHIESMNVAFTAACHELRLADREDDALVAIVAETVISFAQRGERDPLRLQKLVMGAIQT